MISLRSTVLTVTAVALLVGPTAYVSRGSAPGAGDAPIRLARAYLRALYARDFQSAYRHISSADQRVNDKANYVASQAGYSGFAAQVARKLAGYGDIRLLKQATESDRPRIEIAYSFPAPEDLAPLVLNWDEEKLNALSAPERRRLLDGLQQRHRDGKLVMVQGRESLDLIKEGNGWKIFFDWASGLKVRLSAVAPNAAIYIRFARKEIVVVTDEPFQVNLTLKNNSNDVLRLTVAHRIAPNSLADHLAMIECGLSRPVTLDPGSEREFAMAYLLSDAARHGTKELELTYLLQPANGVR